MDPTDNCVGVRPQPPHPLVSPSLVSEATEQVGGTVPIGTTDGDDNVLQHHNKAGMKIDVVAAATTTTTATTTNGGVPLLDDEPALDPTQHQPKGGRHEPCWSTGKSPPPQMDQSGTDRRSEMTPQPPEEEEEEEETATVGSEHWKAIGTSEADDTLDNEALIRLGVTIEGRAPVVRLASNHQPPTDPPEVNLQLETEEEEEEAAADLLFKEEDAAAADLMMIETVEAENLQSNEALKLVAARIENTSTNIHANVGSGHNRRAPVRAPKVRPLIEQPQTLPVAGNPADETTEDTFQSDDEALDLATARFDAMAAMCKDVVDARKSHVMADRNLQLQTDQPQGAAPPPTITLPGAQHVRRGGRPTEDLSAIRNHDDVDPYHDDVDNNSNDGNDQQTTAVVLTATIVDEEHERRILEQRLLERMRSSEQFVVRDEPPLLPLAAMPQNQLIAAVRAEVVNTNRRRFVIGATVVLLATLAVIFAILLATTRGGRRSIANNKDDPVLNITASQVEAIVQFVNQITLSNHPTNLSYPIPENQRGTATAEQRALEWFILNGEVLPEQDLFKATQRFAIVVMAFALQSRLWAIEPGFDECKLQGILCNDGSGAIGGLLVYQHGLSGSIPNDIALLTKLYYIDIDSNAIVGTVPWDLMMTHMTILTNVVLANNDLSGSLPNPKQGTWPMLYMLSVANNLFEGPVPTSFQHWHILGFLDLTSNQLSGTIPTELGARLTKLDGLHLNDNALHGTIPSELGQLTNLWSLDVGKNPGITGTIPTELGRLSLVVFRCDGNNMNGTLPTEIGQWVKLQEIDVADNAFTGTIPSGIVNWTDLFMFSVGNNDFSGSLPSLMGQLYTLDISGTAIAGSLPTNLTNWISLGSGLFNGTSVSGSLEPLCEEAAMDIEDKTFFLSANCSNVLCSCCECTY